MKTLHSHIAIPRDVADAQQIQNLDDLCAKMKNLKYSYSIETTRTDVIPTPSFITTNGPVGEKSGDISIDQNQYSSIKNELTSTFSKLCDTFRHRLWAYFWRTKYRLCWHGPVPLLLMSTKAIKLVHIGWPSTSTKAIKLVHIGWPSTSTKMNTVFSSTATGYPHQFHITSIDSEETLSCTSGTYNNYSIPILTCVGITVSIFCFICAMIILLICFVHYLPIIRGNDVLSVSMYLQLSENVLQLILDAPEFFQIF